MRTCISYSPQPFSSHPPLVFGPVFPSPWWLTYCPDAPKFLSYFPSHRLRRFHIGFSWSPDNSWNKCALCALQRPLLSHPQPDIVQYRRPDFHIMQTRLPNAPSVYNVTFPLVIQPFFVNETWMAIIIFNLDFCFKIPFPLR